MSKEISKILSQFKHRSVRDLAWVIASPPLVSGTLDEVKWWSYEDCIAEFNDCLGQLLKLDLQPEALNTHLDNLKNRRLGSVFEGYISYWLKISPNFRELYQNIQLIEDKHTYGEIDFIIQNIATDEVIHLEVAVKFYLGCEPYTDSYRWFGTNTKDQLGKKIDHLRSHQTQLSATHPEKIKKHFSQTIDAKHCFVKGRLFYPKDLDTPPSNLPLADNHLRGRWSYVSKYSADDKVLLINKSHWLADLNSLDINELRDLPQKTISNTVSNIDRAECFVELEEVDGKLVEKQRCFYLPNSFEFPQ